jgi:hypothetical protein
LSSAPTLQVDAAIDALQRTPELFAESDRQTAGLLQRASRFAEVCVASSQIASRTAAFPKFPLPVNTPEKTSSLEFSIRVLVSAFLLGSQLFSQE